ncbi:MAG: hypothetical protein EOM55_03340 [Clostridia bacterium]|nr:hypothetical protein [Clostridia bacterium]
MKVIVKNSLKVLFYIFLSLSFIFLMFFCLFHFGFLSNFSSISLDNDKLQYSSSKIDVYNNDGNLIVTDFSEQKNLNISEIPQVVVDAFVSIEDKDFYKHNGVNYKRIISATLKNISSFKVVQGASTITQQLIKNTHLTSEKTFKRKINELLLSKKLEENLSKDEIMTAYLNAIYFGNGAFGINQASQRYFSKDATKLNLQESAMLAGLIKSPKKFSPINNVEACIKRRNLVLNEMLKDRKITKEECEKMKNEPLNLKINKTFLGENTFYNQCVDEACKILNLTEKDFLLKKYKINTYLDTKIQQKIRGEIENLQTYSKNADSDGMALLIDNKTGGIMAFYGKSDYDLLSISRQPGSVFKPIISFAPAIENNLISPLTPILDEKIEINGYSPNNYKSTYHGWTSAKKSLANSYNIPAVKILQYVGIENAKKFASKMNVNFSENDKGYSLALGGLTNGINIKSLANCYQAFANGGKFINSSFVKSIQTNDGKIIYQNKEIATQVMKDSTAYLVTDMLKESVKSGTCKKLNGLNLEIASKTGTVAKSYNNSNGNSDVWNVSYTPSSTLCVWFGATKIPALDATVTGANGPTALAQSVYKNCNFKNRSFPKPESVKSLDINEVEYLENNKILLAKENCPERYKIKSLFAVDNLPNETSTMFDEIDDFNLEVKTVDDSKALISLSAQKHLVYEIFRQSEDHIEKIAEIKNKQEKIEIVDDRISKGNFYTYFVTAKYLNDEQSKNTKKSNEVKIFLAQKSPLSILKKWVY